MDDDFVDFDYYFFMIIFYYTESYVDLVIISFIMVNYVGYCSLCISTERSSKMSMVQRY